MMKKRWLTLGLLYVCVSVHAADTAGYEINRLNQERITQHQHTIEKNEYRFSLLRKGVKLGSAALVVAGLVALYRWSSEPAVAVVDASQAQLLAENGQKILDNQQETLRILTELNKRTTVYPQLPVQEIQQATQQVVKDGAKKPLLTGMAGGFMAWLQYVLTSSVTGTIVASSTYCIFQYGLPITFSYLDKVFYTFSYHWFIQHKTHMVACFEELERAAYLYDYPEDSFEYQRRNFIWAYNQLLRECEYTIAFMQVQNSALDAYSFVHARHMRVITKHFSEVITHHVEVLGDARELPKNYGSWLEFVKSFRDKLRLEGESYAQNENYILSRIKHDTLSAAR